MLGEQTWLSDRRVLGFQRRAKNGTFTQIYKEIDAVATTEDLAPTLFAEIKCATKADSGWRKALRQLRVSAEVAALRWPPGRLLAIIVVPNPEEAAAALREQGVDVLPDLGAIVAQDLSWEQVRCVVLGRDKPWARACERDWVDDPNLLARVLEIEAMPPGSPITYTSKPDTPAAGGLGALLKRAMTDSSAS